MNRLIKIKTILYVFVTFTLLNMAGYAIDILYNDNLLSLCEFFKYGFFMFASMTCVLIIKEIELNNNHNLNKEFN